MDDLVRESGLTVRLRDGEVVLDGWTDALALSEADARWLLFCALPAALAALGRGEAKPAPEPGEQGALL